MTHADSETASGIVVWIEGLPGAGKSTMANNLRVMLSQQGRQVEVLDGAEVRRMFSIDLGFSRRDREAHARRVSLVARMLAGQGSIVLVAMATPYETARRAARASVGPGFVEVWLDCPLEVCQARDPNGLYSQAEHGRLQHLTGVDDPFEDPLDPEIVVDTSRFGPEASARFVLDQLTAKGLLNRTPVSVA
jgi:adenylyl-sulfate kinase